MNNNQNQIGQINQEILSFKQNVAIYKRIYTAILNKSATISLADKNNLLSLKEELLESANNIISNIDYELQGIQNTGVQGTGVQGTETQMIQERIGIHDLWEQIYNNDFQEQILINNNLVGSLEDTKLRYTSNYYVYLVNILLAITVICILLHFYFNKNTSTFGSAILLIICILAIYYGAKYLHIF